MRVFVSLPSSRAVQIDLFKISFVLTIQEAYGKRNCRTELDADSQSLCKFLKQFRGSRCFTEPLSVVPIAMRTSFVVVLV